MLSIVTDALTWLKKIVDGALEKRRRTAEADLPEEKRIAADAAAAEAEIRRSLEPPAAEATPSPPVAEATPATPPSPAAPSPSAAPPTPAQPAHYVGPTSDDVDGG